VKINIFFSLELKMGTVHPFSRKNIKRNRCDWGGGDFFPKIIPGAKKWRWNQNGHWWM